MEPCLIAGYFSIHLHGGSVPIYSMLMFCPLLKYSLLRIVPTTIKIKGQWTNHLATEASCVISEEQILKSTLNGGREGRHDFIQNPGVKTVVHKRLARGRL